MGYRSLRGTRILVVEDDCFIAHDLEDLFAAEGADVVLADRIAAALAEVGKGGHDAVLLDLNIRGGFAWGLADEVLAAGVPLCFVSGCPRAAIPVRYADIRNWGKPYDGHALVAGVAGMLFAAPRGPAMSRPDATATFGGTLAP